MSWAVEKGRLVLPSGNGMTASCKHRKSGACGGCHARLYWALVQALESDNPKALLGEVLIAMGLEQKETA